MELGRASPMGQILHMPNHEDAGQKRQPLAGRINGAGTVEVRPWVAILLSLALALAGFLVSWGSSRERVAATSENVADLKAATTASVGELKADVLGAIEATEDRLTQNLSELRSQVAELRTQSQVSQTQQASMDAQIDAIERRVDQIDAKVIQVQDWNGSLMKELATIRGRLDEARRQRQEGKNP